jgi:hypothetical protein
MIQRIQTVYFILLMLLLSSLLSGVEIFGFPTAKNYLSYSVYGLQEFKTESGSTTGRLENIQGSMLFYFIIAFVLFTYFAMMNYKNLKKQFRLARLVFFIYLIGLVSILLLGSIGFFAPAAASIQLGIGYYICVVGLPFSYFAFKGVKKDKEILESLDRLR